VAAGRVGATCSRDLRHQVLSGNRRGRARQGAGGDWRTGGYARVCLYKLEATPSQDDFLAVLVNGVPTSQGSDTWNYDKATGKVEFVGAMCDQIRSATQGSALTMEFRIVEGL